MNMTLVNTLTWCAAQPHLYQRKHAYIDLAKSCVFTQISYTNTEVLTLIVCKSGFVEVQSVYAKSCM